MAADAISISSVGSSTVFNDDYLASVADLTWTAELTRISLGAAQSCPPTIGDHPWFLLELSTAELPL